MLAPGSDRIPVELFQILKDDAVESATLNMQYAGSRQSGSFQMSQFFTSGGQNIGLSASASVLRMNTQE